MKHAVLDSLNVLLAMAPAPAQPGTVPDPKAEMIKMVGMLVLMGVIFYFALIRPQRTRAKQLENLLKTLKTGDKVVTSSGIVGVVAGVKDKTVTLRTADTKIEVLKSAVTEITERSGAGAES